MKPTTFIRTAAAALVTAGLSVAAAAPPSDIRIDDKGVYPESITADRAGRVYIGSVKGVVYRTTPRGDVAEAWIQPTAENGILSVLGVLVDQRSEVLWLCSTPMSFAPRPTGISAVTAFDLATGAFKARYPLPAPASACNDLAIGPDRRLYVTDTPNGRIFTLTPGEPALVSFAQDQRLRGIDGIAFAGDGTLYVNNVVKNEMLRVDRADDGAFKGLTTLTLSKPVDGPDGLRPLGGNRFLQAEGKSGKITQVTITGDRADIAVLRDGLISPPGVTAARKRIYAVEGKINYLFDPKLKGQDPGIFSARVIPLPPR
jgi:hypothetical protein